MSACGNAAPVSTCSDADGHGTSVAGIIAGSGAAGRIKRKDVEAYLARKHADGLTSDRTVIPFNTVRKRTAAHMVRSKATSPHVLQAVEVDFHRVERPISRMLKSTGGCTRPRRAGCCLTGISRGTK